MTVLDENDQVLAGEYALGLLGAKDARAFEKRMGSDVGLREAYREWCEMLVSMAPEPVSVPFGVKQTIDAHLFGARRSIWKRFGAIVTGAGAVLAALALVGYLNFGEPQPDLLAQVSADDSVTFQAAVTTDDRVLRVSALVSVPPTGRSHELWIVPNEGAPVSLGILSAGQVVIPDGFVLEGALLAISVEQPGGSPTGAPTTTPIAAGQLQANPDV